MGRSVVALRSIAVSGSLVGALVCMSIGEPD